jgi:diguanylate cyclase (GGDEF)-like protein
LTSSARAGDAVARFGGDEFMLVVSVEAAMAAALGERLSGAVRSATRDLFAVTVSIGIAIRTAPVVVEQWVLAADEAMFAAKRSAPGSVRAVELPG